MKRLIYFAAIAVLALGACKGNENKENAAQEVTTVGDSTEVKAAAYVCPMDCESGVVYDKAGKCPVCGMDLEIQS
ncbi:MAG: hypothetical protein EYC69_08760 [Bacteroidetes bacterium]|nr:MAG: hypothetical protein EYC69_08760 [Bacteroidota bacterium]